MTLDVIKKNIMNKILSPLYIVNFLGKKCIMKYPSNYSKTNL